MRPAVRVMLAVATVVIAAAWDAQPTVGAPERVSRVGVSAREFSYVLSRQTVKPGRVRLQLVNQGEDEHDLRLRKSTGRRIYRTRRALPGEQDSVSVRMTRGTWTLWCSLPGHRAQGMRAKLRVR